MDLIHSSQHRSNILGPKHFIVEEENEALLAKELQEAKIQSPLNGHGSIHSSQPHIFNFESSDCINKNSNVIIIKAILL